jgi:hypothetical protein
LQPFAAAWGCAWDASELYGQTVEEAQHPAAAKGKRYQDRVIKLDWDDEILAKTGE